MLAQPRGEGVGGSIGYDVNRPVGVRLEKHGRVSVPTASSEVVHPQHLGGTGGSSGIRRIIGTNAIRDTDTANLCANRLSGRTPNVTAASRGG